MKPFSKNNLVAVTTLLLFSCQSGPKTTTEVTDMRIPASAPEELLKGLDTAKSREFDLKFFKSVYEKNGQSNFLMSPTSIRILLGMVYLGTDTGSTSQKELANALGISEDKATAREQLRALAKNFTLKGEVTIDSGNIVYAKRKLEQKWMDDVKGTFNGLVFDDMMLNSSAKLRQLETQLGVDSGKFNQDPANNISRYVEKVTNDMIKDFVKKDDISDPLLVAVLVNALYFKGTWDKQFQPLKTKLNQPFEGPGQTKLNVDYMVRENNKEFRVEDGKCFAQEVKELHFRNDRVQVLSLPFKKVVTTEGEGAFAQEVTKTVASMYFILPRKGLSLDQLVAEDLTSPKFWKEVKLGFRQYAMTQIKIPRFQYETSVFDLLQHAKKKELGISGFINRPEVHNISREIDEVTQFAQKAAVTVNEEGAELAAATKMGFGTRSVPMPPPVAEFVADRPFAYALVINDIDEIAFLGTVKQPAYTAKEKDHDPAGNALAACYKGQ